MRCAEVAESASGLDPLDADVLSERLAGVFQRIQDSRMQGMPILNPALRVQVVGGRLYRGDWFGVLITPWCMNIVVITSPGSANWPGKTGTKQVVRLLSGEYEFIASEEPGLGPFAACSLFSPMGDFPDQPTVVATAEAVVAALFDTPAPVVSSDVAAVGNAPTISRRELLRGAFRGGR